MPGGRRLVTSGFGPTRSSRQERSPIPICSPTDIEFDRSWGILVRLQAAQAYVSTKLCIGPPSHVPKTIENGPREVVEKWHSDRGARPVPQTVDYGTTGM